MRKMSRSAKAFWSVVLSSCALWRSSPKGFSTMSRRLTPPFWLASPAALRFSAAGPKYSGEVAR